MLPLLALALVAGTAGVMALHSKPAQLACQGISISGPYSISSVLKTFAAVTILCQNLAGVHRSRFSSSGLLAAKQPGPHPFKTASSSDRINRADQRVRAFSVIAILMEDPSR